MKPRLRADLVGVRTVSGVRGRVVLSIFWSCCCVPRRRNSVLEGFNASMLRDIHDEMAWNVEQRADLISRKSCGFMEM